MGSRGYYRIPILESASGFESRHSVVFGSRSRQHVLESLNLTFDSIQATRDDVSQRAVRGVYKDNLEEYQSEVES